VERRIEQASVIRDEQDPVPRSKKHGKIESTSRRGRGER
jgi:hypothetical protein